MKFFHTEDQKVMTNNSFSSHWSADNSLIFVWFQVWKSYLYFFRFFYTKNVIILIVYSDNISFVSTFCACTCRINVHTIKVLGCSVLFCQMYKINIKSSKLWSTSFSALESHGISELNNTFQRMCSFSNWSVWFKVPITQITVRNSSWGKVMFSQASPRAGTPLGRHPPGQIPSGQISPLPSRDSYCSGRYASYWNAFLLQWNLMNRLAFHL